MRTTKRNNLSAAILILLVSALFQGAVESIPDARASVLIPFTEHNIASYYNGANSVHASDVDGDGDMDVISAASSDDQVTWWENDGEENFSYHTIDGNFNGATAVYATDVDSDGDVDVLGAAFLDNEITWWENDGSASFSKHTIASSFDMAMDVYADDVDGDGDVDVLGAACNADQVTWWENDGSENFTQHTIDDNFDCANSVYASDLDKDGDVDVLGAAHYGKEITWWENDGGENFTEHTIDGSISGYSIYASDIDGDGNLDVLAASYVENEINWWQNDGEENFVKNTIASNFDDATSVYASDVDGDGDMDVLGAAYSDDEITWWENDGSATFVYSDTQHIITKNFEGAQAVYAADVDGDGDVDVLGAASGVDEITWWEQGTSIKFVYIPMVLKNAGVPAGAPQLYDISNPDGDGDYTVSWSVVERATSYILEEDDNPDFSSPYEAYDGASTSKSITGRDIGVYYYRVKATSAFGSSDWSETKSVEVTVAPTEPPCPDEGRWSGNTDQGLSIDFYVSGCDVSDLTIEYRVICTTGIMVKEETFDYSTPIDDDSFEFDNDGDPTVSGDFDSSSSASGSWSSEFYMGGIGDCSGSGSWSADGP